MKKRILIALFAGASVFGLALAFAASLGLTPGNLQAGDEAVASCQTTALSTTYTVSHLSGSYKVNTINVTGIAAGCVGGGRRIGVTVTDASGTVLYTSDRAVTAATETFTPAAPSTVSAAAVDRVHAVVYAA